MTLCTPNFVTKQTIYFQSIIHCKKLLLLLLNNVVHEICDKLVYINAQKVGIKSHVEAFQNKCIKEEHVTELQSKYIGNGR